MSWCWRAGIHAAGKLARPLDRDAAGLARQRAGEKLSGSRNLLIDVNPARRSVTALDINGSDLLLARQRQWGVWQGSLNLNAAEATFNRTDIRRPSLALNADSGQINVTEMSAFVDKGMLEGGRRWIKRQRVICR